MDQQVGLPWVVAFAIVVAAVVDYAIEMGVGTTYFAGLAAAVGPSLKMVAALAEKTPDSALVDGLRRELEQQHAAAVVAVVVAAELELLHS